ncbi:MAG: hypothetical protein ACRYGK_08455 [Janthinobacterium lividum]
MNASPIGPTHPASNNAVTPPAHNASPLSTKPAPPSQITLTVKPTGLLDSFDLPGVARLTSDIDSQFLKLCTLPTLAALVQVSKSCSTVVQKFIECPGEPDGAHDTVRRLRLQRRLDETKTKYTEHQKCSDSVRKYILHKRKSPDKFKVLAETIAREQICHIDVSFEKLPYSLWPESLAAVTSASQWKTLTLGLYTLERDRFIDHAGDALRAIHYGSKVQQLKLVLNQEFSENDACALLGYLRATPQCKSLEISPGPDTCTALKILAAGLPETEVEEFRIARALKSEQYGILNDVLCNPKLKHFSAVEISLNGDLAKHFSTLLKNNTGLRSLLLSHNYLTDDDAITIAQGIGAHPALESLYFSDNIGAKGWAAMGEAIGASRNLADVTLPDPDWTWVAMPLKKALAFIEPFSNSTRLLNLDWRHFPLTPETLPYLQKLVQNNPAMFALGRLFIKDMEMAENLAILLADISHPLTVDCRGNDEVCEFLGKFLGPNPLLRFTPRLF